MINVPRRSHYLLLCNTAQDLIVMWANCHWTISYEKVIDGSWERTHSLWVVRYPFSTDALLRGLRLVLSSLKDCPCRGRTCDLKVFIYLSKQFLGALGYCGFQAPFTLLMTSSRSSMSFLSSLISVSAFFLACSMADLTSSSLARRSWVSCQRVKFTFNAIANASRLDYTRR